MFGLTKREQFWKAQQLAMESLMSFKVELSRIEAKALVDATELARLRTENTDLRVALQSHQEGK